MAYALAPENLLTPKAKSESFYKEKGSKFLGFLYPVSSQVVIKEHLASLRQLYPDATHICYAWRLGEFGEIIFANDDGEPAHSAGAPILRAIRSAKLNAVLIAVVRYYGGTKLGIPGLINAYQAAANIAIEQTITEPFVSKTTVEIQCTYSLESKIRSLISRYQGVVINSTHTTSVLLTAQINTQDVADFLNASPCPVTIHGRLF